VVEVFIVYGSDVVTGTGLAVVVSLTEGFGLPVVAISPPQ